MTPLLYSSSYKQVEAFTFRSYEVELTIHQPMLYESGTHAYVALPERQAAGLCTFYLPGPAIRITWLVAPGSKRFAMREWEFCEPSINIEARGLDTNVALGKLLARLARMKWRFKSPVKLLDYIRPRGIEMVRMAWGPASYQWHWTDVDHPLRGKLARLDSRFTP